MIDAGRARVGHARDLTIQNEQRAIRRRERVSSSQGGRSNAGGFFVAHRRRAVARARSGLMRIDLRTAALDDAQERRVRLAAPLLAAHGLTVAVSPWDGTRCAGVVLRAGDAYGERVRDLAQRRGVPVVALGDAADASVACLVAALRGAFADRDAACADNALVVVAGDAHRGCDLVATFRARAVTLSISTGRVFAHDAGDLAAARDALGESGWRFTPAPSTRGASAVSSSLDAFLLLGALRAKSRLPAYADDTVRLRDWPDLASAPDARVGLVVARALIAAARPTRSLALADVAPADVNACLWAFRASDLLERAPHDAPCAAATLAAPRHSLLARLAARFGLHR